MSHFLYFLQQLINGLTLGSVYGLIAMFFTGVYGWTLERIAYRPLRRSFRLAPLISAIGASVFLQNYVQLLQGARTKPLPPIVQGGFEIATFEDFTAQISYLQIFIILLTIGLMVGFNMLIAKTPLGRAQRACEQDMTMAALLGVDVDRTISLTFVMGAALAAVAGMM